MLASFGNSDRYFAVSSSRCCSLLCVLVQGARVLHAVQLQLCHLLGQCSRLLCSLQNTRHLNTRGLCLSDAQGFLAIVISVYAALVLGEHIGDTPEDVRLLTVLRGLLKSNLLISCFDLQLAKKARLLRTIRMVQGAVCLEILLYAGSLSRFALISFNHFCTTPS